MYDSDLKLIYRDILNGRSEIKYDGRTVYIKHMSLEEDLFSSLEADKFLKEKMAMGALTEAQKIKELIEEGEWSNEEESFIKKNEAFVESLYKTKAKLVIPAQIKSIEETIKNVEEKLKEKKLKKVSLIGTTCEKYADRRKEEALIFASLYSDEGLKNRVFSREDFEYLENEELSELLDVFYKDFVRFSDANIKKIALSGFFFNFFAMTATEDSCQFFDKRPYELTFFQQKLLFYARNARRVFENNNDVPEHVSSDYDALMEYNKDIKDKRKVVKPKDRDSYSMVGATKEEMEKAGVNTKNAVTPFDMLRKSGKKSLSKKDFIN